MSANKKFTNDLSKETSPYLLQHAHNPVQWKPWSETLFATATAADKPILLSIGYAACHWCHVMERESFEDEAVAEFMNTHFINIKVDREERPDIDHIYMDALHQMTRCINEVSAGWKTALCVNGKCRVDGSMVRRISKFSSFIAGNVCAVSVCQHGIFPRQMQDLFC